MKRSTPLARKTELKRKSTKPRRVKATCSRLRCKRTPLRDVGMCRTHAKQECDRLFSAIIRAPGRCVRCGKTDGIQCSHIVSRRYLYLRWEPKNAEPVCLGCHHWQHMHPLEAELEWDKRLNGNLHLLKRLAVEPGYKPDYAAILADLRAKAAALELVA